MNLLAHLHLSAGHPPAVAAGNLLADYLRRVGEAPADAGFREGVRLHRAIDVYTETHPATRAARACIAPPRRRLAGIIVDVAWDYFLTRDWARYAQEPLRPFVTARIAAIRSYLRSRAPGLHGFVERAMAEEWLLSYGTLAGLEETFQRISRRSRAVALLPGAGREIARNEELLHRHFSDFYPRLRAHCARFELRPEGVRA